MRQVLQPVRGGDAQLVEQLPVVAQEMARGVHAEHAEFGAEPFGVVEVGQLGGGDRVGGRVGLAERQLALRTALPAPLRLGDVQHQVPPVAPEGVQRAHLREPFGDRPRRAGAGEEVLERDVGAPRDDPLRLGLAHAAHIVERKPEPVNETAETAGTAGTVPTIRHQFDSIGRIRRVHIERQHRHPHRRASASSSRFGYMPGSCVSNPA